MKTLKIFLTFKRIFLILLEYFNIIHYKGQITPTVKLVKTELILNFHLQTILHVFILTY